MITKCRTDAQGKLLPANKCPTCGEIIDAATIAPGQGDHRPREGDLSVCVRCGEALEFGPGMNVQVASVSTLMATDDLGREIIGRAQELIRKKRGLFKP